MKRIQKTIASFREAFIWHMSRGYHGRIIEKIKFYVSPYQQAHDKHLGDKNTVGRRLGAVRAKEDLEENEEDK